MWPNKSGNCCSTLNILGLYELKILPGNFTTLSLKQLSRLGIQYHLHQFSPTPTHTDAVHIHRLCSSLYGVCLSCVRGSFHTALLHRVQSKALDFATSPPLTGFLPLTFCCHAASLSYLLSKFSCWLLSWPHCTRLSTLAHPCIVQTPYTRVGQYFHSFIPFNGKIWNTLPSNFISSHL